MEQGFIAKRRWDDDFEWMDDLFKGKDGFVYFIEDEVTHKWYTKTYNRPEGDWTTDPLEARQFKSDMEARTYAVTINMAERYKMTWIITEHKFDDGAGCGLLPV